MFIDCLTNQDCQIAITEVIFSHKARFVLTTDEAVFTVTVEHPVGAQYQAGFVVSKTRLHIYQNKIIKVTYI